MHIGVIGAGIIGLTTALELQKTYPNIKVTLIADKFEQDTVSYVAAGLFRPGASFSGPTEEITRKWIYDAFEYWECIRKSSEASLAGVAQLSGYIFSSTSPDIVRNPLLEDIVPIYRPATKEELKICPGSWKYGSFFTTTVSSCAYFLPWATNKFLKSGGQIIKEHIEKFEDLHGKYDTIFNCSGFGAKTLCQDRHMVPIRGQVIKVKAPWLKMAFYADYDTYIIPGPNSVTLGGCRQYDSYSMDISKYDSAAIKERCEKLLPSLVGAPVIAEAVALRPHRSVVRVEPEIISTPKGNIKVIHNYGHGGYGVTVGPGTAIHAVKIFNHEHLSNSKL